MLFYLVLFVVACAAGFAMTRRSIEAVPALASKAAERPPMVDPRGPEPIADTDAEVARSAQGSRATASARSSFMVPRRRTSPRAVEAKEPGDQSLTLSDFIPPGEHPTAARVIEELHARGIYDGLGAFNPPGTSPPMVGLAVPDDFELPEGYVRHYQTTDDGQDVEPILMFSPDYDFVDENGNPIPIPADRVVPPELAPPGLPVREIEIPPDRDQESPAH